YAARSGNANGKMGWIEVNVYRERRRHVDRPWLRDWTARPEAGSAPSASAPAPEDAPAAPAPESAAPADRDSRADGRAEGAAKSAPNLEARKRYAPPSGGEEGGSFPGTGWGPRTDDPAVVVRFDPEPAAVECVTLRYEYAGALRALGVLPRPWWGRDRL